MPFGTERHAVIPASLNGIETRFLSIAYRQRLGSKPTCDGICSPFQMRGGYVVGRSYRPYSALGQRASVPVAIRRLVAGFTGCEAAYAGYSVLLGWSIPD